MKSSCSEIFQMAFESTIRQSSQQSTHQGLLTSKSFKVFIFPPLPSPLPTQTCLPSKEDLSSSSVIGTHLALALLGSVVEETPIGSPSTTSSSPFPQQKFTPTWFGPIIVLVLTKKVAVQNGQRKRASSTMLMLMMLVPVQTRKLECRDPTN